ncbi:A24 family peptidase [Desulfuromonas versatilis]|nr:A24 family peptidase [Desulfuromonas versatilis]
MHKLQHCLTGFAAASLSLFFIGREGIDLSILFASVFFLVVCVTDTVFARIPNLFSYTLALLALGYHALGSGLPGLNMALAGLLTGLGMFLLPFLLGGMGAGDVKALAALGALVGPGAIFQIFLYTAFLGGAMAIVHSLCKEISMGKSRPWRQAVTAAVGSGDSEGSLALASQAKVKFPFAPAIAFGYYAYLGWGAII